jgi:acetylornithine deacetylase/succinyl-diaminopimelate desuccinylase-like protein
LSSSQHRQDHNLRAPHWDTPRSQSSTFKKESDAVPPLLPDLIGRPRVSPDIEGKNSKAQEHASKEKMASAGVTAVSIGRTDPAGFSPRTNTAPSETETSQKMPA